MNMTDAQKRAWASNNNRFRGVQVIMLRLEFHVESGCPRIVQSRQVHES